jgi:hypothetical protein
VFADGPSLLPGNARLLHPAKRPNFVALNALAIKVAQLVIGERRNREEALTKSTFLPAMSKSKT